MVHGNEVPEYLVLRTIPLLTSLMAPPHDARTMPLAVVSGANVGGVADAISESGGQSVIGSSGRTQQ